MHIRQSWSISLTEAIVKLELFQLPLFIGRKRFPIDDAKALDSLNVFSCMIQAQFLDGRGPRGQPGLLILALPEPARLQQVHERDQAASPERMIRAKRPGQNLQARIEKGLRFSKFLFVLVEFPDVVRRAPDFGVRKGKVICSGLRPEGWAQTTRAAGEDPGHAVRPAGDISTPDDPWGWHEWPERPPMCMRRHRRIDVRRVADAIVVDSFFRDSCWEPDGSELSLHEYTVEAEVDANAHTLNAVRATPRVLPFPECQWAAPNVDLIIGMHVDRFRTSVQETLTELQCCTHLNDMLRGLAEVPKLAAALD